MSESESSKPCFVAQCIDAALISKCMYLLGQVFLFSFFFGYSSEFNASQIK